MAQVGDQIKVGEISYSVYRAAAHPTITGRQMLFCQRLSGKRRYVVTQYEDGSFSTATAI